MSDSPTTRASLLMQVKDCGNQQAWQEFVEIYRPVVYRLARRRGLQHADAEDLAQQTLLAMARAIERFEPDPSRGRFRTWLGHIAQNLISNALSRGAPWEQGTGDSALNEMLAQLPAASDVDTQWVAVEYRREVFRWTARQIRKEFQAATWQAFWLTAVEGRDVNEVAASLGKNPGAIYTARSRVMKRLREKVQTFEGEQRQETS